MANVLDCNIVVSEFEILSRYLLLFRESMNFLIAQLIARLLSL